MLVKYGTALTLLMLACACGGDTPPQSPSESAEGDDDGAQEETPTGRRDASTSKDGGKGTSSRSDAGNAGDDDDDGDDNGDDGDDDDSELDAGTRGDAGRDAGRDAGTTRDAGAGDAGTVRDAGSSTGGGCSALTYESFGKQFITDYCVACHMGNTTGPRLDSLQGVVAVKASVKNMVSTMSMPPRRNANQPTAAERQQLSQWIDCGPK